jgi:hypothetical protein
MAGVEASEEAARLADFADQMDRHWTAAGDQRPKRVEILPATLPLENVLLPLPDKEAWLRLPHPDELWLPVGWDEYLQLVRLDVIAANASYLIAGTPQSGKTNLLESIAVSIALRWGPAAAQLYALDMKPTGGRLSNTLTQVGTSGSERVAKSPAEAGRLLDNLLAELQRRLQDPDRTEPVTITFTTVGEVVAQWPRLFLLVDDLSKDLSRDFRESGELLQKLDQCLELGARAGLHLFVAGDATAISGISHAFIQRLRASQRGFLFVSARDGAHLFNLRPLASQTKHAMPGRMLLAQAGSIRLVQAGYLEHRNFGNHPLIRERLHLARGTKAPVDGSPAAAGQSTDRGSSE